MTDAACGLGRPRDRILDTARNLFRRCGIRGAGVDAIAENAGTNKMTLYRHFRSKDELIVACLNEAATEADKSWVELEAAHPADPKAQLDAWVDAVDGCIRQGQACEIANAAVELPEASELLRTTIAGFKNHQRQRLGQLCAEAGIQRADALADMLCLLIEGARVSRQTLGQEGPSHSFSTCARSAIAAFSVESGTSK